MRHHIFGHGALQRHGCHVGLADLDLQTAFGGNRTGPQRDVTVGDGKPIQIIGQFQQDRVVDDRAAMVAQRHIFALTHLATRQIARRQYLRQPPGIGPPHLHLPSDPDIPLRHALDQPPIFRLGVTVTGGMIIRLQTLADVRPSATADW